MSTDDPFVVRRECRHLTGYTRLILPMIDGGIVDSATGAQIRSLGSPSLIIAGPALALVRQWDAELTVLRRRSPSSDAATILTTCLRDLVEAIRAGRDTRLHLTVAEVHATSGIPVSTLRWLCKHKPELVGAQKHEGVWYVDRGKFERYMATSDRGVPAASASNDQPPGDVVEAA